MNKQDGEKLLPLVNNVDYFNIVLEYVDYRIASLHKILETSEGRDATIIQGQIRELRRFKSLRDEVLASEYSVKK